jgi:hypothetical protein
MILNKNSMKLGKKDLTKYVLSNTYLKYFEIFFRVIYPQLQVFQKKQEFDVNKKFNHKTNSFISF